MADPESEIPRPVLSYQSPGVSETLVRIRRYRIAAEANLAHLKLESMGIRSTIAGEALAAGLGIYGQSSGQVDLFVPQSDEDEARKILDEIDARIARRLAITAEILACPRCKGTESRKVGFHYIYLAVGLFTAAFAAGWLEFPPFISFVSAIAGVYFFFVSFWRRTCRNCGKNWSPPPVEIPDDEEDEDEDD